MKFVRYQSARNRFLGFFAIIGTAVGGFFGYQSMSDSGGQVDPVNARSASANWQDPAPQAQNVIPPANLGSAAQKTSSLHQLTKAQRYVLAMKFANVNSRRVAKAKDVLGARNPWKLNLYDDNQDGQWDRGKLDTNRDEVDDEKWTFKNGSWEKDDGRLVWSDDQWVVKSSQIATVANTADQKLALYRAAIKIASARANASGKGKDVLGGSSPWKLNLYDDDRDGQWDRGKLDTDRDELDDEKWTFKNGRWEKESGTKIWTGDRWQSAQAMSAATKGSANPHAQRYRHAMKLATGRANRSGKGKDVLGGQSPWKLNLYDDNRDGQWDRGKLDTNRDEVADEKWNFKNGRWEKDGGASIWDGEKWIGS